MYKEPEDLVSRCSLRNLCKSSNCCSLPGRFTGAELCRAFLAFWYFEDANSLFGVSRSAFSGEEAKFKRSRRAEGVVWGRILSYLFCLGGVEPCSSVKEN